MAGDARLDVITRRLAEIAALLSGSAREPSPEHFALLNERDRLRAEAVDFQMRKDEARSTRDLESELVELRRRLKSSVTSRTGYVMGKGGNNQGPASGAWLKLGLQSRESGDIARLNARIAEIEDELATRGPATRTEGT